MEKPLCDINQFESHYFVWFIQKSLDSSLVYPLVCGNQPHYFVWFLLPFYMT